MEISDILAGRNGDECLPAVPHQRHRLHGVSLKIDHHQRFERVRLVDPPVAGVLVLKVTLGKLSVESSDAGILNPVEPVSTATLGMMTQLVVEPGVQTWTVVNATFT